MAADLTALSRNDVRPPTGDVPRRPLAYVAADGTPRVLPMPFGRPGEQPVMSSFAGAHKVAAGPDVAVTAGPPPEVPLLRGRVALTGVERAVPECALARRRRYERAAEDLAGVDRPGPRALRPSWAAGFRTRFPGGPYVEETRRWPRTR